MSLLQNLIKNKPATPPPMETKGERLEVVIENLIENLPLPARIVAQNHITSYQLYNDDAAEKVCAVLQELKNYIDEGIIPHVEEERTGNY